MDEPEDRKVQSENKSSILSDITGQSTNTRSQVQDREERQSFVSMTKAKSQNDDSIPLDSINSIERSHKSSIHRSKTEGKEPSNGSEFCDKSNLDASKAISSMGKTIPSIEGNIKDTDLDSLGVNEIPSVSKHSIYHPSSQSSILSPVQQSPPASPSADSKTVPALSSSSLSSSISNTSIPDKTTEAKAITTKNSYNQTTNVEKSEEEKKKGGIDTLTQLENFFNFPGDISMPEIPSLSIAKTSTKENTSGGQVSAEQSSNKQAQEKDLISIINENSINKTNTTNEKSVSKAQLSNDIVEKNSADTHSHKSGRSTMLEEEKAETFESYISKELQNFQLDESNPFFNDCKSEMYRVSSSLLGDQMISGPGVNVQSFNSKSANNVSCDEGTTTMNNTVRSDMKEDLIGSGLVSYNIVDNQNNDKFTLEAVADKINLSHTDHSKISNESIRYSGTGNNDASNPANVASLNESRSLNQAGTNLTDQYQTNHLYFEDTTETSLKSLLNNNDNVNSVSMGKIGSTNQYPSSERQPEIELNPFARGFYSSSDSNNLFGFVPGQETVPDNNSTHVSVVKEISMNEEGNMNNSMNTNMNYSMSRQHSNTKSFHNSDVTKKDSEKSEHHIQDVSTNTNNASNVIEASPNDTFDNVLDKLKTPGSLSLGSQLVSPSGDISSSTTIKTQSHQDSTMGVFEVLREGSKSMLMNNVDQSNPFKENTVTKSINNSGGHLSKSLDKKSSSRSHSNSSISSHHSFSNSEKSLKSIGTSKRLSFREGEDNSLRTSINNSVRSRSTTIGDDTILSRVPNLNSMSTHTHSSHNSLSKKSSYGSISSVTNNSSNRNSPRSSVKIPQSPRNSSPPRSASRSRTASSRSLSSSASHSNSTHDSEMHISRQSKSHLESYSSDMRNKTVTTEKKVEEKDISKVEEQSFQDDQEMSFKFSLDKFSNPELSKFVESVLDLEPSISKDLVIEKSASVNNMLTDKPPSSKASITNLEINMNKSTSKNQNEDNDQPNSFQSKVKEQSREHSLPPAYNAESINTSKSRSKTISNDVSISRNENTEINKSRSLSLVAKTSRHSDSRLRSTKSLHSSSSSHIRSTSKSYSHSKQDSLDNSNSYIQTSTQSTSISHSHTQNSNTELSEDIDKKSVEKSISIEKVPSLRVSHHYSNSLSRRSGGISNRSKGSHSFKQLTGESPLTSVDLSFSLPKSELSNSSSHNQSSHSKSASISGFDSTKYPPKGSEINESQTQEQ